MWCTEVDQISLYHIMALKKGSIGGVRTFIFPLAEERQNDKRSTNANTKTARTNAILNARHFDTRNTIFDTAAQHRVIWWGEKVVNCLLDN